MLALLAAPFLSALACGQAAPAEDVTPQLLQVRRLYIDQFSGDSSAQVRAMVIAALQRTKLFVLTENPDRADAILRGSAEDLIFTDVFQSSEGVRAQAGVSSGERRSASSGGEYGGVHASFGDTSSVRTQERKHEASASVRIVNKEGDVIWSTVQESLGGKFRGASADVADRVARQLASDMQRLRGGAMAPAPLTAVPVVTPQSK